MTMISRIGVIIATLGRPAVVSETVRRVLSQSRPPERLLVVIAREEDAPEAAPGDVVEIVRAPLGLCAQRNAGLDAIGEDVDIVAFLDDDFVAADDFLQNLAALFELHPDVVGATGDVVLDGVTGPGLTFEDADLALSKRRPVGVQDATIAPRISLYGANMIYRLSAVGGERFDQSLPLYGWLEDVDFSMRVGRKGPMIKSNAIAGVHLGNKGGRTSGVRLGYSQIANPLYLLNKGTITPGHAAHNIVRNLVANHVRVAAPEPYVDRRGRVKGNWMAVADLVRGRLDPGRVLAL